MSCMATQVCGEPVKKHSQNMYVHCDVACKDLLILLTVQTQSKLAALL